MYKYYTSDETAEDATTLEATLSDLCIDDDDEACSAVRNLKPGEFVFLGQYDVTVHCTEVAEGE